MKTKELHSHERQLLMIEVDGSVGEGGGQIVRMALALGLITGTPFRLHSIRAKRPFPGLKMQLLHFVSALRSLSRADIRGDMKGSTELMFVPGEIEGGAVHLYSQAAISIPLLLEGLMPIALRARGSSEMVIEGGTDIANSMSLDYYLHVIAPRLGRFVLTIERRGFYPSAGGRVRLAIEPQVLSRLDAPSAPLRDIRIMAVASETVGERAAGAMVRGALDILSDAGLVATTSIEYCVTRSPGAVISLIAELENGQRLGADALLISGEQPERAGTRAAEQLRRELSSGAAVDSHAVPALILHLALEGGGLEMSTRTPHVDAAIHVCEQFLGPRFHQSGRTLTARTDGTR